MGITKIKLDELSNTLKGSWSEALGKLRAFGLQAIQDWEANSQASTFLTIIASAINGESGEILSQEEVDTLLNTILPGKECRITFGDNVSRLIEVEEDGAGVNVYIDENLALSVTRPTNILTVPVDIPQAIPSLLMTCAYNFAQNQGLLYAISQVCEMAGNVTDWVSLGAASAIQNVITTYSAFFGPYYNQLIKVATAGPEAVLAVMASIFDDMRVAQSNNDVTQLLSSTSYVVNQFAWGIVVETVGVVISVIGMITMMFSKVLGIIVALFGQVVSWASKLFLTATTHYEDTKFKVNWGFDSIHCFSFVISQGEDTNAYIANYMRSYGTPVMSILNFRSATVLMVALADTSDPMNNTLLYEEHLSTDFDLTDIIVVRQLGNPPFTNSPHPVVYYKNFYDTAVHVGWFPRVNYNPGDTNPAREYNFAYIYDSQYGTPTDLTGNSCSPDLAAFKPVSFQLIDRIKGIFDEEIQAMLEVRLCSALIIHLSTRLRSFCRQNLSARAISNGITVSRPAFTGAALQVLDDNMIGELFRLYDKAWECFCNPSVLHSASVAYKSVFGLDVTQTDDLVNGLSSFYDALSYSDPSNTTSDIEYYWVDYFIQGSTGDLVRYFPSVTTTRTAQQQLEVELSTDHSLTQAYISARDVGLIPGYSVDPGWSKKFLITMPKLTFKGFLLGVVVDILVIAALTTVTIFAIKGVMKVLALRAQYQAKATTAAFNYGDGTASWAEYKSARLKYNLLSLSTGGSWMSINGDIGGSVAPDTKKETAAVVADANDVMIARLSGGVANAAMPSLRDIKQAITEVPQEVRLEIGASQEDNLQRIVDYLKSLFPDNSSLFNHNR